MDSENLFYLVVSLVFTLIYLLLGIGLMVSAFLGMVSSLVIMFIANSGFDL